MTVAQVLVQHAPAGAKGPFATAKRKKSSCTRRAGAALPAHLMAIAKENCCGDRYKFKLM